MEGFLHYRLRGLIFGGVYTSRGLFSEFYSMRLEPILSVLCLVGILAILCFVATAFSLKSVFYCKCSSNQFFIGTESSHADTRKECASVTLSNVERCMHLIKNGMDVFFMNYILMCIMRSRYSAGFSFCHGATEGALVTLKWQNTAKQGFSLPSLKFYILEFTDVFKLS